MKKPPIALMLLGSAAAVLAWIAWRSPEPTEKPTWAADEEGQVQVPTQLIGTLSEGAVQRELAVEGMCCNGCTHKLYDALLALPAVEQAAVDFESGRALAVVPADFDASELERALAFDKYSAKLLP